MMKQKGLILIHNVVILVVNIGELFSSYSDDDDHERCYASKNLRVMVQEHRIMRLDSVTRIYLSFGLSFIRSGCFTQIACFREEYGSACLCKGTVSLFQSGL